MRWLSCSGLPSRRCSAAYLRWKPGTSCIAALELASGSAYAATFSAVAGAKLAKTLEQARAGSVLLVDRQRVRPRGPARGGTGPPALPRSYLAPSLVRRKRTG